MQTTGGLVEYEFGSALTVLAGSVGVGKSTLFELIKHGLGGEALLADVVETSITSVTLEVTVGAQQIQLTRSTLPREWNRVRVFDIKDQQRLPDHFIERDEPRLNTLLLDSLDLPDDMRAAASGGSTNQGARITFNDVFKYMYISQGEINKQIAGSGDTYYQPKRRAVFEVLFDLTSPEILELRSQIASIRGNWEGAEHDFTVVQQFLLDSNTQSRLDAEMAQFEALKQRADAEEQLDSIRELTTPAIDRETQMLRQLLGEAERTLAESQNSQTLLQQQHSDFKRERNLIDQDIQRLDRMKFSGQLLANIEFSVCPRCMQSVKNRNVPAHSCRLCLQPDPVIENDGEGNSSTYEQDQLRDQAKEMDAQLVSVSSSYDTLSRVIEDRKALIVDLSGRIQERTQERITPQLQAFADATARRAEAEALQRELEKTLIQWDRADDLEQNAVAFQRLLDSKKGDLNVAEAALNVRRIDVFDELDDEFSELVSAIGLPGVKTAKIDRKTYLPVLNGKSFQKFSPVGGLRTATQVAYWISLMNVSLRRRDTHFPAFLLMDSPRTSLNNSDDLSAALYRKLVTMADAAQGRVQVIIGDNELPADYRQDYEQFDFDYDHPTVPTVRHPGREAVRRIGVEEA
jgi:hypothetical protein